jgi:hypothetical protein
MPHTGIQPRGYIEAEVAMLKLLKWLYYNIPSRIDLIMSFQERDQAIRERYAQGESIPTLAKVFAISNARVHQILHGYHVRKM